MRMASGSTQIIQVSLKVLSCPFQQSQLIVCVFTTTVTASSASKINSFAHSVVYFVKYKEEWQKIYFSLATFALCVSLIVCLCLNRTLKKKTVEIHLGIFYSQSEH